MANLNKMSDQELETFIKNHSTPEKISEEIEKERLQLLSMIRSHGHFESDQFRPGTLNFHEVYYCLSLVLTMFNDEILSHPSIVIDSEWFKQAKGCMDSLFSLSQSVERQHLCGENQED